MSRKTTPEGLDAAGNLVPAEHEAGRLGMENHACPGYAASFRFSGAKR